MGRLLDLVALGTVADVVVLDRNNRILVNQGLKRIRSGNCIPGISALLEISEKPSKNLTAPDLGFSVAPRLNAAGRLDDMSIGIECLLTDEVSRAREYAKILNDLNLERRMIEHEMQTTALQVLKKVEPTVSNTTLGVCLFDEEWHQGVIGILAGRIKDRINKPVIAFAVSNDTELKGSARSVSGLHIRDVLADIAVLHPDLILKFGGHAMAAGLTIMRNNFERFAISFNQAVSSKLTLQDLKNNILSDGQLTNADFSLEICELIRDGGPWGQGFPEPFFDGEFDLLEQRIVGSKHLKMVVCHEDKVIDAIAFNVDLNKWPNHRCKKVHLAYRLDINEFRGRKKIQFIVEHIEEK
jgi:single-stranded-DNA-specific exonuclease